MSDPIEDAHEDAKARLLTVRGTVQYLAAHGITVHANTVRYWYQQGRIQIERRGPYSQVFIPREQIDRLLHCPICASRL